MTDTSISDYNTARPANPQVRGLAVRLRHPSSASTGPTRLLLVCHAQSIIGQTALLGPGNVGLSAQGWEETTALAQWLQATETVDAVLTDSSLRARLTAQAVGQRLGVRLVSIGRMIQEGEPAWTLTPPLLAPDSPDLEESARYTAFSTELVTRIDELLAERWGQTIVVVAEAALIATLVRAVFDAPEMGLAIETTSITELRYADDRWTLRYCNRADHLPRGSALAVSPAQPAGETTPDLAAELAEESRQAALYYSGVAQYLEKNSQATERRSAPQPEVTGKMIQDFAEIPEDYHLLMVGAGSGQLALELAQTGISEVVGVDVSPGMLERAEFARLAAQDKRVKGVNFRLAAAHALPFMDGRFDVALCVHLLHHLAKPLPALREIYRVLPEHGRLIVIDVDGPEDAVKRATQNVIESKRNPCHAALRTQAQWVGLLEQAGFVVKKEKNWQVKRRVKDWLDSVALVGGNRGAVIEMLEASIETDAAGLLVQEEDKELYFQLQVFALLLGKRRDS